MRISGLGSDDALSTIADTIQQVEGYYQGTLAYRNNNPGNLVYTSYYASNFGATQGAGGFSKFPDYATGYAALEHQIQIDAASGLTISDMMYKWLGNGTGGDYQGYAETVANALGVSPDARVADVLAGATEAPVELAGDHEPTPGMSPWVIAAGLVLATAFALD